MEVIAALAPREVAKRDGLSAIVIAELAAPALLGRLAPALLDHQQLLAQGRIDDM